MFVCRRRDLLRQSSVVILVLCKCEEGNAALWSHTDGWLPKEWHQVIPTTFTYLSLARPRLCDNLWLFLQKSQRQLGWGHLASHLSSAGWADQMTGSARFFDVELIDMYTINEKEVKNEA